MSKTAQTALQEAVANAANERIAPPARRAHLASVRVSPGGYLIASLVFTFASLLLLRAQYDIAMSIAITLAWVVVPVLAFTDRISFDGNTLSRKGLIPF